MDIFGKKKKRRIIDLELAVANLKQDKEELKRQLKLEEEKNRGERVTGRYCAGCKHGFAVSYDSPFCSGTTYECELMCKCKDFSRR